MGRACTIGTFDGVHLGHQLLIQRCCELGDAVVVTFDPHPRKILSDLAPPPLQSLQERLDTLERYGAHSVEVLNFSSHLAEQSYQDFLSHLHKTIDFEHLIVGKDARIGARREGTFEAISTFAKSLNIAVEAVEPLLIEGKKVSSTTIRDALQAGHLDLVKQLLGRPFTVSGIVISGAGRGAKLGFPTANLAMHGRAMPPLGVYAGFARVEGPWIPAVLNYGSAPTFARKEHLLEVHLLEGCHHLVGRTLQVLPYQFLRTQRAFNSISELQDQLAQDSKSSYSLSAGIQIDFPS